MRYSEKLLQAYGISVSTIDLSEILGTTQKLTDGDARVRANLGEIGAYAKHDTVPSLAMLRMAKLGIVISDWMEANDLNASALQCWTSIQKNYGVNVCTLMSMNWTVRMIQDKLIEMGVVEHVSRGTVHTAMKKMNLSPGSGSSGVSPKRLT